MSEYLYKGREKEYKREWQRNKCHSDPKYLKRQRLAHEKWLENNPDAKKKYKYVWDGLRHRYGMTIEDYDKLFSKQEGKCAICKEEFVKTKAHPRLSVDHNHKTGFIRGLLCHRCNIGLGAFRDNEDYLYNASEYIEAAKKMELELDR